MQHYEESIVVPLTPEKVFEIIDDHKTLAAHMNKTSLMMAGGAMKTTMDGGHGKQVGSHIKMEGQVLGIKIFLDEVVTKRKPPYAKEWQTGGDPQLIVVGQYSMGINISAEANGSKLTVFINYDYPKNNVWLGKLLGKIYAKWCVGQMMKGVKISET